MDISALIAPVIRDQEAFREFVDALADQIPEIERSITELRRDPTDRNLVAALFRGLHTIKGDAAMCRVDLGVMITHPIESVLARLREGELGFSELLAEVVLLALDRLELAVEALGAGRRLDTLKLPELVGGLETLGRAAPDQVDAQAARVIEAVTGFRPAAAARMATTALTGAIHDMQSDLSLFRQLATLLEARSPLFKGRTERVLRLVLDTNIAGGSPVDASQLEAAVCMHDVGMMFLPEQVWLRVGRLAQGEMEQMRQHPALSAGILARMPGWNEAARIVREHHEMPDGRGYPEHLEGDTICAGARILAIADAFEAVTLKQSHRGQSRSLLRAIAEVNASDTQFDPVWIEHFNSVIRSRLEA